MELTLLEHNALDMFNLARLHSDDETFWGFDSIAEELLESLAAKGLLERAEQDGLPLGARITPAGIAVLQGVAK